MKRILLYFIPVMIVILFIFFEISSMKQGEAPSNKGGEMSKLTLSKIDVISKIINLFIPWAIGIIGGVIYVTKSLITNGNSKYRFTKTSLYFGSGSCVLALFSMFFGHLIYTKLLFNLEYGKEISFVNTRLSFLVGIQYGTLLMSLVLFYCMLISIYFSRE